MSPRNPAIANLVADASSRLKKHAQKNNLRLTIPDAKGLSIIITHIDTMKYLPFSIREILCIYLSFIAKQSNNLHNRRKSSPAAAIDVRSAMSPPIINTPSEYSEYIKTAEMDINDASSISEMGPRSPIYTLESLHDIEELMGIEEAPVRKFHIVFQLLDTFYMP